MSPFMRRITRQMRTGKPVLYFEDGKWRTTWFVERAGIAVDPEMEEPDTLWDQAHRHCKLLNAQPFAQALNYDFRVRHKNAITALRLVAG